MKLTTTSVHNRSWVTHLLNALRGMAMGSADIVPGVSGGTIALLLGVYEPLLGSLRMLTEPAFLQALAQRRFREALDILPWRFLMALGSGILIAALTLARLLTWLLVNHPALLWSFFGGLVLASVFVVAGRVAGWTGSRLLLFAIGAVGTYVIVGLVPARTPHTPIFLFLSGALAICAMILPGISGAFILVLLGKYHHVLSALSNGDLVTLAIIAAGAGASLVTVARFLSWLFSRYHDATLALLGGLMLGSLRKLWPWKKGIVWLRDDDGSIVLDDHGNPLAMVEANVFPDLSAPGMVEELIAALMLAIAGFVIIVTINRLAVRFG